ncbi:MAG: pirin family protein [Endomicrobium sp.]|jgi:redox-sensitive bicupin YhaK (pirin superfamily)|nr:pirin family protein [Endomicrobium sp.]
MSVRKVEKVIAGNQQYDGAGVSLRRVLGNDTVKDFDPFLMLDFFDSKNPEDYLNGFPWHPHRGIETVTYLIKGEIDHGDSLNNKGKITDGCCQWMTAGSGIIHQEMPKASPHMLGMQLWINLAAKDKMAKPHYRDIKAEMIKEVKDGAAAVRIISGEFKGHKGAIEGDYVKAQLLDVELPPDSTWETDTVKDNTLFVMVMEGSGLFSGAQVASKGNAVLFGKGDKFKVQDCKQGVRFILLSAKPLKEPVAWAGPIVMNTEEELEEAFEEINYGGFIKEKHPDFRV